MKQLHVRIDELKFEKWVRTRGIHNVNERIRALIDADTEFTSEEKQRIELEREEQELLKEIREVENKLAFVRIQLNDMDAREEKETEERREIKIFLKEELKERMARGI